MVTLSAILEFSQCLFRVKHFSIVVYTNYACKQKELFFFFFRKKCIEAKKGEKTKCVQWKNQNLMPDFNIFKNKQKKIFIIYIELFTHKYKAN